MRRTTRWHIAQARHFPHETKARARPRFSSSGVLRGPRANGPRGERRARRGAVLAGGSIRCSPGIAPPMKNFTLHLGDCLDVMRTMPNEAVDLTVTSPPYDNLRTYDGYSFNFEAIAFELWRITKTGGVVVWVVNDATVNGSKTGTSFRQALFFKEIGFNIHDTMIWNKGVFSAVGALRTRYAPVFDYMFIFSKGPPKTFNPIKDRVNKHAGKFIQGTIRNADGSRKPMSSIGKVLNNFGQRFNIWEIWPQRQKGDDKHPAPFPENLARDHILSWSSVGDTVFDPFTGSGTTGECAIKNGRIFIGSEISDKYYLMAQKRIECVCRGLNNA